MSWADRLVTYMAAKWGTPKRRSNVRMFQAGVVDRLTADWTSVGVPIDQELRRALVTVRSRARDLTQNNDHAKQYIRLLRTNVVGPNGFTLDVNVMNVTGTKDTLAEKKIETAWGEWVRAKNCSVTRVQSFRAVQDLLVQTVGRDGEAFLRLVTDKSAYCGLRLEVIECERVDEMYFDQLPNGNVIKMGVELDRFKRPIAYHLRPYAPGTDLYGSIAAGSYVRERIPAEDLIHGYDREYPNQSRGISWLVQSMIRMKMLHGYEEAAVVNARVAAAKMGFFTRTGGEGQYGGGSTAEVVGNTVDEQGNKIINAEPGQFEQLEDGMDFKPWDPKYPDAQHEMFVRSMTHEFSAGLGVSYLSLTGDLSDTSFSSGRTGLIQERDQYRLLQRWFAETFLDRVYERWLENAIMSGAVNLPMEKFDKFNIPNWIARSWDWVDPAKDMEANLMAIRACLKSPSGIVAEQGGDIEDLYQKIREDQDLAIEKGLAPSYDSKANPTPEPQGEEPPTQPTNGKALSLTEKVLAHQEVTG